MKEQTPLQIQEYSLKVSISALSREDQDKVQNYVDRFTQMINKGGIPCQIAFTIIGVELSKAALNEQKKAEADLRENSLREESGSVH